MFFGFVVFLKDFKFKNTHMVAGWLVGRMAGWLSGWLDAGWSLAGWLAGCWLDALWLAGCWLAGWWEKKSVGDSPEEILNAS